MEAFALQIGQILKETEGICVHRSIPQMLAKALTGRLGRG